MDDIVKKLSEIERTASAVAAHADQEKFLLEQEIKKRRDTFDQELEERTQKEVDRIRSGLEKEMDTLLKRQQADNEGAIAGMKKDFEEKHTVYAEAIVRHMLEDGL